MVKVKGISSKSICVNSLNGPSDGQCVRHSLFFPYIYTYICISKYLFQCYKNSSLLGELTTEASAGRLNRTFRRGPKAASSKLRAHGVCHLCRAGQEGYDFEDMPLILEI